MFLKKVDKLVLKAYLGPFLLTLAVVAFIFLTQHMTRYLDDLVGKDLDLETVGRLLFYFTLTLLPLSLPLAVLLSCLIAFGNLGQHFELTALKSGGISLLRVLSPIFIFIVFVTFGSFALNNYIVPWSNLQAYSLLYDIKQQKPSLNLKEGSFYAGLPNFSMKVNHKYPDNITLKDIMIYDHRSAKGNTDMILADSGKMYTIMNESYLVMELYKGKSYHQGGSGSAKSVEQTPKINSEEFNRIDFRQSKLIFSLESFERNETDQKLFLHNKIMKNTQQLGQDIDSMQRLEDTMEVKAISYVMASSRYLLNELIYDTLLNRELIQSWKSIDAITGQFDQEKKQKLILNDAVNLAKGLKTIIYSRSENYNNNHRSISQYQVEKYRKYTHAVACFIMFLIGAPLGAIIKKGGLGVPVLISIIFFIIFYVFTIAGEKWTKDSIVTADIGMWMANFILFFIGLFFLRQARNDSRLLEWDVYLIWIDKIKQLFKKKK